MFREKILYFILQKLTVFSSKNPVSSVLCCPKSLSVSKSVSASSKDKINYL